MLPSSRQRILELVDDGQRVLDVGGWARPLARADCVIDLMPYETRGMYGDPDPEPERFGADSWVQRDICDREPWPFDDDQFDFGVCSHTLEDVRDPVWVCSELIRVTRAGYIEVPSRLEEQSYGVHGPWVGWSHHRWLVDISDAGDVVFTFKPHLLAGREAFHFPPGFSNVLSAAERVQTLFWEGDFPYSEQIFLEAEALDAYLTDYVTEEMRRLDGRWSGPGVLGRVRRRLRG